MPAAPDILWFCGTFNGIFFENSMKNMANLKRKIIQHRPKSLMDSAPFTAFAANRLFIKFSDQLNPTDLCWTWSHRDKPLAIRRRDSEIIMSSRTEYFFSIKYFFEQCLVFSMPAGSGIMKTGVPTFSPTCCHYNVSGYNFCLAYELMVAWGRISL